jgi:hypothetical protein
MWIRHAAQVLGSRSSAVSSEASGDADIGKDNPHTKPTAQASVRSPTKLKGRTLPSTL